MQPAIACLLTYSPRWKASTVHEPAPTQIASRVRGQRTALELTQEQLAREVGVTHQHVSRIEGGNAVPSLDLLVRLSDRLGVSTDYLLTGKETVPLSTVGVIRGDHHLSPAAKRHLIGIVCELRGRV
jgi:transcriptional regulator with XRE-family HTH domain